LKRALIFFAIFGALRVLATEPRVEIVDKLSPHFSEARKCYEKYLDRHPHNAKAGKVLVTWTFNDKGFVEEARVDEKSEIKEKLLSKCLVTIIRSITFVPGPAGEKSSVNYPFIFSSFRDK
jgi:hypothetical protein